MTDTPSLSRHPEMLEIDETTLLSHWQRFKDRYPTDEECLEELYERARLKRCRHCGSDDFDRKRGDRSLKCRICFKTTWMTANTFFCRIKRPQAWFGRIWLFERGIVVSSSRFHKLAGVSYDTARNIFNKLAMVIAEHMEDNYAPSALFGAVIGKRSRETPAGAHPLAEEEGMAKRSKGEGQASCAVGGMIQRALTPAAPQCKSQCSAGVRPVTQTDAVDVVNPRDSAENLTDKDRLVFDCLSDEPLHFDIICGRLDIQAGELSSVLTMLELAGFAKCLAGNRYVKTAKRATAGTNFSARKLSRIATLVDSIITFLRACFHAISRKNLQHYLAACWWIGNGARRRSGSLLQYCLRFRNITGREVLNYVSPLLVKI